MNDIFIRLGLASIAGLTYFAGAIPADMPIENVTALPLQVWLYATINVLTGFFSPSLLKKTAGMKP